MVENLKFVQLDERAYKYIRQFTIKNVIDAAKELITNSVDAYRKRIDFNDTDSFGIEIDYIEPNIMKFRDHAIGLTSEEMIKYFLTVGNFSASTDSRGFFSRGAKDISSIGDITFRTIKNGKYSEVFLNRDAYGNSVEEDIDVTSTHREMTKLPANGLEVVIEILPNFIYSAGASDLERISRNGVLRDIIMSDKFNVTFKNYTGDSTLLFERDLLSQYPDGKLKLDLTYNVPGYEGKTARLRIYTVDYPIDQPKREEEMVFGFSIKDSTAVYEVSTIDDRFRWNPHMNRVYGTLECEGIRHYMMEYDKLGSTPENPMPIIDPSRITGINREHPFIDALLSIPKVRLDSVLRDLNVQLSRKSITLKEIHQLLDELEKFGLDLIDEHEIDVEYVPDYDFKLNKSIEEQRQKYVNVEKIYHTETDYSITDLETDRWVKEELVRLRPIPGAAYVVGESGEELVEIAIKQSDVAPKNMEYVLDLIPDELVSSVNSNPYIYQLGENGDLLKIFIFEKGRIDAIEQPTEESMKISSKNFRVSFIEDINVKARYVVDYESGVHIQINLADEAVKKFLTINEKFKVSEENENTLSFNDMNSTKTIMFFQELMTDVISQIILETDIKNNKLVLDSNNYNNTKKIISHRNEIVTSIEHPMDGIFEKYLQESNRKKTDTLKTKVQVVLDKLNDQTIVNMIMPYLNTQNMPMSVMAQIKAIRAEYVSVGTDVIDAIDKYVE